jgi:hypothetical protein
VVRQIHADRQQKLRDNAAAARQAKEVRGGWLQRLLRRGTGK